MPIRLEAIGKYTRPRIFGPPMKPYVPKPEPTRNSELDPFGEEIWSDEIIDTNFNFTQLTGGNSQQSFMPIAMRVAAQTIGLDLVAVRPMSSPRAELLFVDFAYGENILTKKTMKEEDYNRTYSEIDPYGEEDWSN
jgi:hypothetical protein